MSEIIKCFKHILKRTWILGNMKSKCMFTYFLKNPSEETKSDKKIKKRRKQKEKSKVKFKKWETLKNIFQ